MAYTAGEGTITEQATEDRDGNWLALAGVCVSGPALVALIPMAAASAMPAMARHFAAGDDGQFFAQMVMTIPSAMLIVSAPLAGLIADRFGPRLVLLAALAIYLIGGAGVLFVDDRSSLFALRLLLGIAGGTLLTSSLALIGESFAGRHREQVLGFATSISSLVAALALMFGGALVDAFGWRTPFGLYLFALPTMAAAWFIIPRRPKIEQPMTRSSAGSRAHLLPIAPYYFLLVLLTIGMFTPAIQLPFLLESRGMTSAASQGTLIATTSIVAMLSAGLFGWSRRWIDTRMMLAIDAFSMGAGIVVLALAHGSAVVFGGCALVGIGAGISEPATASIIFDRTPAFVHAMAMGLIVSALNLGQFLNPVALAPLRGALGIAGAFHVLGAMLILASIVAFVTRRGARRRESGDGTMNADLAVVP